MLYRVSLQVPKAEHDTLELNNTDVSSRVSEKIHKKMIHEIIDKMPYNELKEIRKIELLIVNPFIANGFNTNRPLFKAEIEFMQKIKELNAIHYEVHILTNTEEHGTRENKTIN